MGKKLSISSKAKDKLKRLSLRNADWRQCEPFVEIFMSEQLPELALSFAKYCLTANPKDDAALDCYHELKRFESDATEQLAVTLGTKSVDACLAELLGADSKATTAPKQGAGKTALSPEELNQILQLRRPSIQFRPSKHPADSWFGGVKLGKEGENWPRSENGRPFHGLLQIDLRALGPLPQPLRESRMACLYLDYNYACHLRLYGPRDVLVALEEPDDIDDGNTRLHESARPIEPALAYDYPSAGQLGEILGKEHDWFTSRGLDPAKEFPNYAGVKIGGYPFPIQEHTHMNDLVLQCPDQLVDDWVGMFYVYLRDGNLQNESQCF